MHHLPLTARLEDYEAQAAELLRGHAEGKPDSLRLLHHHHPRFLDTQTRWLPLPLSADDIRSAAITSDDARLALSRWYSFRNWEALVDLVDAVRGGDTAVRDFEFAVEAAITGDAQGLAAMLRRKPGLVHARSTRVTHHDPPVHRATLLHYLAANGVEGYRQRTPPNAVAIARILLEAGAEPDALAAMYGGECTTLSMLVSSSPPADAGVQVPLVEILLDYGANPNGQGTGAWTSPVLTALVFGFASAARVLALRGARIDNLVASAGLCRREAAEEFLPSAGPEERHRALALASQLGHAEIVALLLSHGESADRYNPEGMHAHSTPLHQAALAGHEAVVRLLVEHGARLDTKDKLWHATPRGWAEYGGRHDVAAYLKSKEH